MSAGGGSRRGSGDLGVLGDLGDIGGVGGIGAAGVIGAVWVIGAIGSGGFEEEPLSNLQIYCLPLDALGVCPL